MQPLISETSNVIVLYRNRLRLNTTTSRLNLSYSERFDGFVSFKSQNFRDKMITQMSFLATRLFLQNIRFRAVCFN